MFPIGKSSMERVVKRGMEGGFGEDLNREITRMDAKSERQENQRQRVFGC
jgi:hypothetical protein